MGRRSRAGGGSSFPSGPKLEHSILWSSRERAKKTRVPACLRGFWGRYACHHLRLLPWRKKSVSPFHLLLAEVLLVQTKAEDVARVWPKLIRNHPTPRALAGARRSTLVSLLKPLGLQNQRGASLKRISQALITRFQGRVPKTVSDLLALPHVGLYTATAVACFKFGKRLPIVDANVLRVLGRIMGRE